MMLLKLERSLAAIDVETTGLNVKHDRIVEIGIMRLKPDGQTKEWSTLVNPGVPIPEEISKIHGITNEMVANELPFDGIATGLRNGLQDCDLTGYNVNFDVKFLVAEFKRIHMKFEPGKLVDSFKIFKEKEPKNLTAAVKFYLNETLPDAHRALPDARVALRVLEAQLEKYPDLPRDVNGLAQEKADGKFIWQGNEMIINFGKHSGKSLSKVPRDYFEWMKSVGFPGEIDKIVRDALEGRFPKK